MGIRQDYESKLQVIKAIDGNQIKTPHHIPVSVYIQEAKNLYQWVREDMQALIAAGLSRQLVKDLPIRSGVLVEAEALWSVQRESVQEAAVKWRKEYPAAYDLRNQLLHQFRFAFRKRPDLLTAVKNIGDGKRHSRMINSLNSLGVLGKSNLELLAAIDFDKSLLDLATETSAKMASLLAEANGSSPGYREAKEIRDRAYTHLKEAVDEICEYGQFVFRRNKDRFIGYRSRYIHSRRKKGAKVRESGAGESQENEV